MKGALPEVEGVALTALALKVGCTLIGVVLAGFYLMTGSRWSAVNQLRMWKLMVIMTLTALTAAAILKVASLIDMIAERKNSRA